jgi:hypothetical protein
MVDKIDSLFPCLQFFWMKSSAIVMLVVLHQGYNTHFQGAPWPKMVQNVAQPSV